MSLMLDEQVRAAHDCIDPDYFGGLSFKDYLALVETRHPRLHAIIAPECRSDAFMAREIARLDELSWEFEGEENGGRGNDYNRAQRSADNRRIGMTTLLSLFGEEDGAIPGPETIVLDALAGDGTLRRFAERLRERRPEIISADLSRLMTEACLDQGYPCIRQSAAKSFLADGMLDGVLIAYGSHHLAATDRRLAAAEAHRTLKPGGRLVLHDFETGGRVDRWFRVVVDPYSLTGHPHPHFSRAEMTALMQGAGFREVRVFAMDDPFVLSGASAEEARRNVLRHLHAMYGLVKLPVADGRGLADRGAGPRDAGRDQRRAGGGRLRGHPDARGAGCGRDEVGRRQRPGGRAATNLAVPSAVMPARAGISAAFPLARE